MDNKLDPIHAVASLSLALIEIQKDISQLRRQSDTMVMQLRQIDAGVSRKFKELDMVIDEVAKKFEQPKQEVPNAAYVQRKENTGLDAENLRSEEG